MNKSREKALVLAWILIVAGFVLVALPWSAELFTMREEAPPITEALSGEGAIGSVTTFSYSTAYIAPWIPLVGGVLLLAGGLLLGSAKGWPPPR